MSETPLYSIRHFDDMLTSELRRGKVTSPRWWPAPCSQSPEVAALMHDHPDGLQHFAVWQLLQATGMREWKRSGVFVYADGSPMPAAAIAREIGLPGQTELVQVALDRLCQAPIGLITKQSISHAGASPDVLRLTSGDAPEKIRTTGQDRTEQNKTPPSPPKGGSGEKPAAELRLVQAEATSTTAPAGQHKRNGHTRTAAKGLSPPPGIAGTCLDTPAFRNAWGDWVRHRIEIKKPLTPTSSAQQIRKFIEIGHVRSIEAIRHTILKGWQGIREPDQPGSRAGRDNASRHRQNSSGHDPYASVGETVAV